MKRKILIIENNYYKYFSLKALLEAKYHLNVKIQLVKSQENFDQAIKDFNPDKVVKASPDGVLGFEKSVSNINFNKRNTEIVMILTPESQKLNWPAPTKEKALAA